MRQLEVHTLLQSINCCVELLKVLIVILDSPLGGATLADGVSDLRNAITAFEALDGSFIDKLHDFDELRVGAEIKYSLTCFQGYTHIT